MISFSLAGQEFSFSEKLKEPVVNIASLSDIIDVTIDIRKDTLEKDAYFQVRKKYMVLRTNEIPEDKDAQVKQMFQIMEAIRASIICGDFIGLIVLDGKDRYIGSFDRNFFLETIIPWSKLAAYPVDSQLSDRASWIKMHSVFGFALEYPKKENRIRRGISCKHSAESVSI